MNEGSNMVAKNACWPGYLRKNGRKGIRNKLLILYTVECASFVAKEIGRLTASPHVDVVGFAGCTDNEYAVRLLIALIRHPNVGGVLVVGLGCEYIQPKWLATIAEEEGKLASWLFIQQTGGTEKSIKKGTKLAAAFLQELQKTPQTSMYITDLVLGAECGGSDYTSGLAGNAVVGRLFNRLVSIGGTALFEEILETIGLLELLQKRGANKKAKQQIEATYYKALQYCNSTRQYSISPGNFAGGLSTIEEKSMGAVIKSGTQPIQGVLKVAQNPPGKGLWLLDTTPDPHWMQFGIANPNDNEGLLALAASGCQLLLMVTGRGNVVGSAVAPVLKITGNHNTYLHMQGDMDFDAGLALTGQKTLAELEKDLLEMVLNVAIGKPTKSETLGHKEYHIPYKYQTPGGSKAGCAQQ
ncbi:UxaA family hydrolase [Ruminococcaceae bacterium OttesenSCG-928-A16]|nr:UxaA family hydrolase [Ruminococcaceae bacterium OttesenSCG-928-A16]